MADDTAIPVDLHVFEGLLRDLAGRDRSPASYAVYLYLWGRSNAGRETVRASHQSISDETGLAKRTVQEALRRLHRRGLVSSTRESMTAIPEYTIQRPWLRRQRSNA
jgi:predicted transcriptional regulator